MKTTTAPLRYHNLNPILPPPKRKMRKTLIPPMMRTLCHPPTSPRCRKTQPPSCHRYARSTVTLKQIGLIATNQVLALLAAHTPLRPGSLQNRIGTLTWRNVVDILAVSGFPGVDGRYAIMPVIIPQGSQVMMTCKSATQDDHQT